MHASTALPKRNLNGLWLIIAFALLIGILILPTPADLPVAGQRALAILAFAIVLWVTEAVTYTVSAFMIIGLIAILLGLAPPATGAQIPIGSSGALKLALSGFSSPAVALVGAALFLAAAMQATNFHKRLALLILSRVGVKTNNIVIGAILVSIALAFFVPSATARAGSVVPILLGMVAAFGLAANSRLSALLVITAVQAVSIWNVGIKTAAAQNMVAVEFMDKAFGYNISWGQWLLYAGPWAVIMSIILYFVMIKVIKPETNEITGGQELVRQQLADLGPISAPEKRLIAYSVALLFFWSTENIFHSFDNSTVTLIVVAMLLTPKIGVFDWATVEKKIPWGTLIVFAVGVSLGTVLLQTQGASWFSGKVFGAMGLADMPLLSIIAILAAFNILIHLGFASATSLASALIPIVIALVSTLNTPVNQPGFVLIQQFVISFGFLLPVSAPQNMLAYGTGAFTVKDFLKSGIPLTIAGYLLVLLFSATYWKWIGLL